jgi:hypothetical protein
MAREGRRFIAYFADAIAQSAPHIYISALALAPKHSWIYGCYKKDYENIISVEVGQLTEWPATVTVMEGHRMWVWSVVGTSTTRVPILPVNLPTGF